MLISCLPQCHQQVGALHMKKQVVAIRRKIAKPGPGLRLCVQGIPRIFHGVPCFWPYSAQKKDRPISRRAHRMASSSPRIWKRPGKSPASMTLRADTLPLLNGKDVVSQPVKACIPSNWRHLEPSLMHVWLMSGTVPSQR